MRTYRFCDLLLESDVPLPELDPGGRCGPVCRVRLRSRRDDLRHEGPWRHHWKGANGAVNLSWAPDPRGHRLGFPGLARFHVAADGCEIHARAVRGTSDVTLRHLLLDQVLPRAMALTGRLVLHAGAVRAGAAALAFVGESGRGKSTLVAGFSELGHEALADDCAVVEPDDRHGSRLLPSYAGLRLLPDALERVVDDRCELTDVADYTRKRRVRPVAPAPAGEPVPLRALFLLEPPARRTRDSIEIERVSLQAAFTGLLRGSFQLDTSEPGRLARLFDVLAAVAAEVPVFSLVFPRDFTRLADVRDAVLDRLNAPPTARSVPSR
jgi:hypothetical protein